MKDLLKSTLLWWLVGLLYALPTPALAGQTEWANGPIFRGVEVTVDLPGKTVADGGQRVWNIRAPLDGLGCCVFASIDMAARYQNIRPLIGVIDRIKRGGGWPEKVTRVVEQAAQDAGSEPIEFVQYLGSDPSILDLAMKTGRPVCITYGYGEYPYNGATIAHMVLLVHLDEQLACIIDNNNPLYDTWMSRDELLRRWLHPRGQGWAVVFLAPPAPPVPHNL
jgi:hypothetical protein